MALLILDEEAKLSSMDWSSLPVWIRSQRTLDGPDAMGRLLGLTWYEAVK
jgi:hypothetical protein